MVEQNTLANSILILLSFILTSCSVDQKTKDTGNLPNIVIIVSDDQGWGDLGINGNTNLSTPNIDKLAQQGATFSRFYVSPVCSPTRAELLTGRYHVRGGVYSTSAGGERLDLDETTFAEIFKKAGYKTAAFGKWHNGMQPPYHPNARGFDEFYGFCSGHWGNYFNPVLEHNGKIVKGNGFIIDDLTEKAMDFIESNKNSPFLVYLPLNTPHSPMQVPDTWWNKFENMELAQLHRDPEKENILHTKAALAMCENIDWNVGRLIDKLEQFGLSENTIVVYFSDNGPNGWRWNDGMKGRKGSVDEGGVRSPLFVWWVNTIDAGIEIPEVTSVMDIFPTLIELTGINSETGKPLDGKSLKPLLFESEWSWQDRVIVSHWGNRTSLRNQNYRLDQENKLFDMENDPGQRIDISNQYPEKTGELVRVKEDWERNVLTELPEKDTRPFTIGDPDFIFSQIPARDGTGTGNIQRSNRYPNDSFFTNWISTADSIYWDAEILKEGDFEITLYYTCEQDDIGTSIQLSFGSGTIESEIDEAHNPPLQGMENDRVKRIESYIKDFKPLTMGTIHLEKGIGPLVLKALDIPGDESIDFRLLMFKRVVN